METSLDPSPITQAQPSKRHVNPFGFAQRHLPWVIGMAFLIVYGLTLSRGISYQGLPTLARAAGWDWNLFYHQPLQFLVMYPVRWLPAAWQVAGLNVFSAVCSVLTLALLARSVAILPYDRTRDERQLERNEFSFLSIRGAWLPPVFAAAVCGLQLTFWEHSIMATTEAIDLLLFAYCTRCLLEYRLDQRNSWLYRMAFVLGLAITSDFAMIGFLPAFLAVLIWIKGRHFFNVRFIATMVALGAVGLLLYLMLPAINSRSPLNDQSFWDSLKLNIGYQKSQLSNFPRYIILWLALTSLVPVTFIGIKWPNQLGDTSAVGNALTNLMTHVIHAVLMIACLYVAFDPPFSPRKLAFGRPMLPFYYLGALSIGYFAGYFLLVFGQMTVRPWQRYRLLRSVFSKVIAGSVWIAAVGVPVGLIIKNLPEIRKASGPYLARVTDVTVRALPESGGVIMSDDPYRLYTVYEALQRKGTLGRYLLLDSTAITKPAYFRYLEKRHAPKWLGTLSKLPLNREVDVRHVIKGLFDASQDQRIFYLQPSFGYYFEYFYLEPHQLAYELKRYPTNSVTAPEMTAELWNENDAFWREFIAGDLAPLRQPTLIDKPRKGQNEVSERNPSTFPVAMMYSRALTWLGVEAQKAGQLERARDYFKAALELNPDNPSAFVSLDYNAVLRAGKTESTKPSEGVLKRLAYYGGNWEQVIAANGPADDPNACLIVAQIFARGRNFRQSAQNLYRTHTLNPTAFQPRITLAGMLVQAFFPDKALELIEQIRNEPKQTPLSTDMEMTLIQSEAWAYIFKNDLAGAERVLTTAAAKYPADDTPLSTLVEIYFRIGQSEKAVTILEQELNRDASNPAALINYAAIKIQRKEYEAALPLLDRAIKADSGNCYALLNRAIANLHLDRLDDARRDYELILTKQSRVPYSIYYGLAEVAWRQKRPKAALKHYTDYMKAAPRGTPEFEQVQQRIRRLKSGAI
jgi:tetratricopeptide (TPR) repeat protein